MATIAFWFDYASPYSYPAAMRIEDRAGALGIAVEWHPVILGPIFADLGWQGSPFVVCPAKGAYMWRDLARVCAGEGLGFQPCPGFPQNSVLAARVGLIAAREGWVARYSRAVFQAAFRDGGDIADGGVLRGAIAAAGADPERALGLAVDPANRPLLRDQVARAQALGIFGAPVFMTGGEMFWGFDRLDAALAWVGAPALPPA